MARVYAFDAGRSRGICGVPPLMTARNAGKASGREVAAGFGEQPSLFARLTPSQVEIVTSCAEARKVSKGEQLFRQGQPHAGVFIIQSGIIRTYFVAPRGREITLAYWRPGNIVGTPMILSEGVHHWSGEATADSDVLVLRSSTLRSLVEELPELAVALIEALEFKGKCFSRIVQMLGTMTVSERIIDSLNALAAAYGTPTAEGTLLRSPFTHEAIASMVGASRQWVTIELHNLEKKGIVRLNRRTLLVLHQPQGRP